MFSVGDRVVFTERAVSCNLSAKAGMVGVVTAINFDSVHYPYEVTVGESSDVFCGGEIALETQKETSITFEDLDAILDQYYGGHWTKNNPTLLGLLQELGYPRDKVVSVNFTLNEDATKEDLLDRLTSLGYDVE